MTIHNWQTRRSRLIIPSLWDWNPFQSCFSLILWSIRIILLNAITRIDFMAWVNGFELFRCVKLVAVVRNSNSLVKKYHRLLWIVFWHLNDRRVGYCMNLPKAYVQNFYLLKIDLKIFEISIQVLKFEKLI